METAGYC